VLFSFSAKILDRIRARTWFHAYHRAYGKTPLAVLAARVKRITDKIAGTLRRVSGTRTGLGY
jgi:hypothetical protein